MAGGRSEIPDARMWMKLKTGEQSLGIKKSFSNNGDSVSCNEIQRRSMRLKDPDPSFVLFYHGIIVTTRGCIYSFVLYRNLQKKSEVS